MHNGCLFFVGYNSPMAPCWSIAVVLNAADYICGVEQVLSNPVYNALLSGDADLALGNNKVRFFEEEVSPFAGFDEAYSDGFGELHRLLPQGRMILYATPKHISIPKGWKALAEVEGLQFVLNKYVPEEKHYTDPVLLDRSHVAEMKNLTALTRPGPFGERTIEFGSYFGIIHHNRLVAMAGQRLHVAHFTEISAVCTHPDFAGKGFAKTLLHHQINRILRMGQTPFLHVRADNTGAVKLYEKIGFEVSRPMNFYFLQRV